MSVVDSGGCCAVVSNVLRGLRFVYSDGLAGVALSTKDRQAGGSFFVAARSR